MDQQYTCITTGELKGFGLWSLKHRCTLRGGYPHEQESDSSVVPFCPQEGANMPQISTFASRQRLHLCIPCMHRAH